MLVDVTKLRLIAAQAFTPQAPARPEPEAAASIRDAFAWSAPPRRPAPTLRPVARTFRPTPPADPLPQPISPLGETDYYRKRAADFQRRHPELPVPSYYLGYGDKYVNRFTDDLFPRLSPAGQQWLVKARRNLQVAIEEELRKDPAAFDALERDDEAFLEFAYETHPKAYLDAGFENLTLKDMVKLGFEPDMTDLLTLNGLEQVAEVARGLAAKKARGYLEKGLSWKVPTPRQVS